MPSAAKAIYWDSNCFLSYVDAAPDRIDALETLLASSAGGETWLYTSAISQVEVAFGASERKRQALDPNVERQINSLWADPEVVAVVDYHSFIGEIAKGMIRDAVARGWSLKPVDAIQLATAQWLRSEGVAINEFHTYDRNLFRFADICGFRILEPYIEQPNLL